MDTDVEEGWGSKKLAFGLLSVVLIFSGWLLTNWLTALNPSYTTMVGGLTGIFALFTGGSIGHRFVASRHVATMKKLEMDAPDDDAPDAPAGTGGSADVD